MELQRPEDDILIMLTYQYQVKEIACMFDKEEACVWHWLTRARQRLSEQGIEVTRAIEIPDKVELLELYRKYTISEIAKRYHVTTRILREWYRHYGLGMCPPKDKLLEDIKVLSYTAIADKYLVKVETVHSWVKKYEMSEQIKEIRELKYPTKEEFIELFQQYKAVEIARMYGVTQAAIIKWVKRAGCEKEVEEICRAKRPAYPTKDELEALLEQNRSCREIAEQYKVSLPTVRGWIKKLKE